jgi:hypothetical protein
MSRARPGFRFSALVGPYLWIPVAGGALLVTLAVIGVPAVPLAILGAGLGIAGGLVAASISGSRHSTDAGETAAVPPEVMADPELVRLHRILCEALTTVAGRPDGNPKEALTQKLIALGVQFRAMASGAAAFTGTESWYVAHDAVLAVPNLKEYRAILRVRTADCARDPAIQESLRATFAAAHRGVLVERILVLPDFLWPGGELLPADDIRPWIEEQHNHGLRVILLRERDLATEPDLLADTCVFDGWAVGTRDLDDRSQTVRVALDFTPTTIRAALDRLDRLSHLGIPFGDLLDRADRGG